MSEVCELTASGTPYAARVRAAAGRGESGGRGGRPWPRRGAGGGTRAEGGFSFLGAHLRTLRCTPGSWVGLGGIANEISLARLSFDVS